MRALLSQLTRDDAGQDLIEYALLAGFIVVVSVAAITNIGIGLSSVFTATNDQVQGTAAS